MAVKGLHMPHHPLVGPQQCYPAAVRLLPRVYIGGCLIICPGASLIRGYIQKEKVRSSMTLSF